MELLRPNFVLDNRIKNITPQQNTNLSRTPSFRAGKGEVGKELGDYVLKSLNADNSFLKDTFNNPKKRETFLQTLGSIIVATAATLTNILTSSDEVEETPEIPDKSVSVEESKIDNSSEPLTEKIEEEKVEEKPQEPLKKENHLEFKTLRGKKPQIETDYIDFVHDKFADNEIVSNKLTLLFNEFCGVNRNNKHLLNDEAIENKVLVQKIFNEIKENADDTDKLSEITSNYLSLAPVENIVATEVQTPAPVETAPLEEVVISDAEKEKLLDEELEKIKTIFTKSPADVAPKTISKAVSVLKKQFPEDLNDIENLFDKLSSVEDKKIFIIDIANKIVSNIAVKDYLKNDFANKIDFRLYNELKKAEISNSNIKKISDFLMLQYAKDLEITNNKKDFNVKITNDYSINNKFKKIMNLFNLIKSQEITLTSNDKEELNADDIIEELKKDYFRNDGRVTYKNLIAYLYGMKHNIKNLDDFEMRKNEHFNGNIRFSNLLNTLNNEKIFNNALFSNHSKLRFIERFVLNENFGNKSFDKATREKVRSFIETLKKELSSGITVCSYYADDNCAKIGAQIRFQNPEHEDIIITLNSQGKMHTII